MNLVVLRRSGNVSLTFFIPSSMAQNCPNCDESYRFFDEQRDGLFSPLPNGEESQSINQFSSSEKRGWGWAVEIFSYLYNTQNNNECKLLSYRKKLFLSAKHNCEKDEYLFLWWVQSSRVLQYLCVSTSKDLSCLRQTFCCQRCGVRSKVWILDFDGKLTTFTLQKKLQTVKFIFIPVEATEFHRNPAIPILLRILQIRMLMTLFPNRYSFSIKQRFLNCRLQRVAEFLRTNDWSIVGELRRQWENCIC